MLSSITLSAPDGHWTRTLTSALEAVPVQPVSMVNGWNASTGMRTGGVRFRPCAIVTVTTSGTLHETVTCLRCFRTGSLKDLEAAVRVLFMDTPRVSFRPTPLAITQPLVPQLILPPVAG